ncbi:glycoside hydrolase family 2 TIM barrel-domain containing protein [Saccharicrinis aurantiacus]|uniref:glycoside hydrolase family 2 TIM barrel-domain containing protein n=1 Tax=Saccharicrinis aurantiacus TaxID=1849719 RepID=UPI00248F8EC6|nr:glycoside hydrolase family 2 TIM barrel-domain containing protein [Saccharicrinis aurantiacus]
MRNSILQILLASTLFMQCAIAQNEVSNFNNDWSFILDEFQTIEDVDLNNKNWQKLDLPHDWSVALPFDSANAEGCTGYLPGGIGWYSKEFSYKKGKNEKTYIYFDGVYNHSEYWLNGKKIGKHIYGYSPHYFDLTPYLQKKNVLLVKVDRTRIADSRWYTGSGIYRNVQLIRKSDINIPIWGAFVSTPQVSKQKAIVNIAYKVVNHQKNSTKLEVELNILDDKKSVVKNETKQSLVVNKGINEFNLSTKLSAPKLWSTDEPNMYTAQIILKEKGKIKHVETIPFGIRSIRFDVDKGFFLNDVNMKIKGVCIHHDGGAVGAAVPKAVWERRLNTLKGMGCNAIRMAHNPSSDELLDLCDEMGFLVQDEFFDEWSYPKDKRKNRWDQHDDYKSRGYGDYFDEYAEEDLKCTVLAHRNHPSVFQWSIGNEIEWTFPSNRPASGFFNNIDWTGGYFWSPTPFSPDRIKAEYEKHSVNERKVVEFAKNLSTWTKEIDTTRPITANCILPSVSLINGYADYLDVVGFSYRRVMYDYSHELYPDKVVMGTENLPQWHEWKAVMERDFVSGVFLWTGFDHMGEVNGRWPSKSSPVGIIDQAGFPKPGYHMYRSLWTDEPYLNILTQTKDSMNYLEKQIGAVLDKNPDKWENRYWYSNVRNEHWNYKDTQEILVEIMSNCPQVEVFLDGQSQGIKYLKDFADRTYKWFIPYKAGVISAVGIKDGKKVKQQIATAQKPYAVKATIDKNELKQGEVAHITLNLVDEDGKEVKYINKEIEIQLPKGISNLGIDNGYYRSVQSYQSNTIVTHKGRALLIVKAEGLADEAKITIKGDGLKTTFVNVVNNTN